MAHQHRHHHHVHDQPSGNLGTAFALNLVFSIIEIIGGIWTNSLAVLSDAIHDFGDSLSIALSWYLEKKSVKGPDQNYSYGYVRFSLLGAVIICSILIVSSIFIVINAIPRLLNPEVSHGLGMLGLATVGILFNGLAYFKTRSGKSQNEKMVSLHLLEDVLGWTAVFIGAIIISVTGWYIIDPLLSIAIACYICYNAMVNLGGSLRIFLQGIPTSIQIDDIYSALKQVNGIEEVHDIHLWTLDGYKNILTAHLIHKPGTSREECIRIKNEARKAMEAMEVDHCTFELESEEENCVEYCY